jgi:ATP:ADP antiporter, AAA family
MTEPHMTKPVSEIAPKVAASPLDRARALLNVGPGETRPLVLSFVYSFAVLAAYYVLRSVRDEMGVQLGKDAQAKLYSVVFLVMLAAVPLFGWIVSRFPRRQLVAILHGFFILNLLAFWALFHASLSQATPPKPWLLATFYVWVSSFNVFIVSLFWSTMSSMWTSDQAKRLYGVIAAGATAGVFCGPVLTSLLVGRIGQTNLMLVSAAFLGLGVVMARKLTAIPVSTPQVVKSEAPTLSTILSGAVNVVRTPYLLHIAIVMFIINLVGTFFYLEQSRIVGMSGMTGVQRTQFFAKMDIITAVLQVLAQVFLTGRVIERLGLGLAACALPVVAAVGLLLLSGYDSLAMVAGLVVVQRAIGYGISTPAMRVFYTVVPPDDKYKAQNFIDTVVFRGGDASGGWIYGPLAKLVGMNLSAMAIVTLPLVAIWAALVLRLGREHAAKVAKS